jgi:hypothetical protein
MTKLSDLHNKWRYDPDYRAAYEALEGEFAQKAALIEARKAKQPTTQSRKTAK